MSSTHKISRRKFLYAGAAAAGCAILASDGLVQSNEVHVVKVEISLQRLPQAFAGLTVAQLSDFHYDEHFSDIPIRKSVDIVNELKPDLVVLTGDYVTAPLFEQQRFLRKSADTVKPCAEILRGIAAPKYAVMGNHDAVANPPLITRVLETNEISVMRNRSIALERGKDRIWLAGIDDLLRGTPQIGLTLAEIPPDEATILLAHEPDFADDAARYPIDLQLSGHSHGGQIWIPGMGAPWLPSLARKYPRGLYKVGNLVLYTNIGVGTVRAPIRINCPPEVTLITLRAARPPLSGDQK